jgi:hypothetical protein
MESCEVAMLSHCPTELVGQPTLLDESETIIALTSSTRMTVATSNVGSARLSLPSLFPTRRWRRIIGR